MFFVTGDLHGNLPDYEERKYGHIRKDDYIIVCGDFGMIWEGNSAERKKILKISRKKHTTLFVDGAHENFDLLARYPVTDWNGGKVQVINGNLIHLMRGQLYTINGKKIFTFGGGESNDREVRIPHKSWWAEEMPDMEEMHAGIERLVANNWDVDYIFTYEAPSGFRRFLEGGEYDLNPLNVFLECIREKCKYKKWVFGKYHMNRHLSENHEVVFDSVIKLD